MKLSEIAKKLRLECLTPELKSEAEADVTRGYVSDLLSDVLANAPQGGVLVTVQVHMNVLAVCLNAEVAGVIFAHGRTPDEAVRKRAVEERMPLYLSREPAFDVVGKLTALGVTGAAQNKCGLTAGRAVLPRGNGHPISARKHDRNKPRRYTELYVPLGRV